jgi:MFS family permease
MFILGGALSDRYGAKAVILCGCIVRVAGYLLLAFGHSLWSIILGACLTGIGGALFSPSIEALLAKAGTQSETNGKRSRAEWFALFAVCGELGPCWARLRARCWRGSASARWRSLEQASLSAPWWYCTFASLLLVTANRR